MGCLTTLLVLSALWWIYKGYSALDQAGAVAVLIIPAALLVGAGIFAYQQAESRKPDRRATVDQLIGTHLPTLTKKYQQNCVVDDYGILQLDAWNREVDYFLSNVVGTDLLTSDDEIAWARSRIESRVQGHSIQRQD